MVSRKKREQRALQSLRDKEKYVHRRMPDVSEAFFEIIRLRDKAKPHTRKEIRKDPCAYCGSIDHVKRTVDHINPKSNGGSNSCKNLASACDDCNAEKASMSLLEYLLFRLDK